MHISHVHSHVLPGIMPGIRLFAPRQSYRPMQLIMVLILYDLRADIIDDHMAPGICKPIELGLLGPGAKHASSASSLALACS